MPRREPDKTLDSTDAIGERGEEIRGGEPPTGILGDDIIYNTNNIIKHNAAQEAGTRAAAPLHSKFWDILTSSINISFLSGSFLAAEKILRTLFDALIISLRAQCVSDLILSPDRDVLVSNAAGPDPPSCVS
jgi:hypothetical protein